MAAPTGTHKTYEQVGDREDLIEAIKNISPIDTPVYTNAMEGSMDSTFQDWQTDSYAAASHSASIEGDDTANTAASPTVRIGNYAQIIKKVFQVSGTSRAIRTAGRSDELAYQGTKAAQEVKRNLETSLNGLQPAVAGNATTAREMAGLGPWLFENEVGGSGASTANVTSGAPTTAPTPGTDTTLTEAQLKTAFANAWTAGGNPSCVLVGAVEKQKISGFGGIATQHRDNPGKGGPAVIIGAADVYVSDFNTHYIVANRFQPVNNVYVLDFDDLSVNWLRNWDMEALAKTGDSDRMHIVGEMTLCVKSPASHSKIYTTDA